MGTIYKYVTGEPLQINSGPHLFLDDALIEDRWALTRRINPPYRHMGNPIIVADRPWEERPYRPQVFFDDNIGRYRMYYQCFSGVNYWSRRGPSYYTCYAESKDGLNWRKPELPSSAFGDYPVTNVIHVESAREARIQAPWVFRNVTESDSSKAYSIIYNSSGLRLAHSPDGIRWTPAREEAIFNYHSDTCNHVVWNEQLGLWMLYMRPPVYSAGVHEGPGRRHYRRRTAVSLSEDLLSWTVPRTVLYPDELDLPDYDSTHVFPYRDQYIGMITIMNQDEGGTNEVMLATSRDGFRWERPLPRQTWVARGKDGNFDAGCVSISSDPVYHDWELWFYTTGFPQPQQIFEQEGGIGLTKMIMDRFLSLEAPLPKDGTVEDYGYLLTKEFIWHGKRLVLNCRMKYGSSRTYGDLKVEIVKRPDDANPATRMGEVMPGYSFDDCDLIRSNCPNQVVAWNKNDDISFLDGQPIYLRFRIRNGGLFSFMMEE